MTDATPAEIMRRLDDVSRQLVDVVSQLREDRMAAAKLYVTREVHTLSRERDNAAREEVAKDVFELKTENKRNSDFKRQVILGSAFLAATSLVTMSVAISNYLAR